MANSTDRSLFSIQRNIPATVLVTGGTRGLGKAIGKAFAQTGADVTLTHRWGSVDEDDLAAEFRNQGLPRPRIVESDVSNADDMHRLMRAMQQESQRLDVIVSNVSFAKTVTETDDLRRRALDHSLSYSAWPIVELVRAARETFGAYPHYVIGVSSNGADVCHPAYDLVGVSKAVLETLCRYLALRLKSEGTRVNAIRPGFLDTASARATFGDGAVEELQARFPDMMLDPLAVAKTCVALCSGYMDAVTGQVITVDAGWGLVSPVELLRQQDGQPPIRSRSRA